MTNQITFIPAIDLLGGQCVRLAQGDYAAATVVVANPFQQVTAWVEQGAQRLHIVDLDGARDGTKVNDRLIGSIARQFPDLIIQVGGGIRDVATIEYYLQLGIRMVILGTHAIEQPDFLHQVSTAYPQQIIAGLDTRAGLLATKGWQHQLNISAHDFLAQIDDCLLGGIIHTDIDRDGMMQGANVAASLDLSQHTTAPVYVAGGVSTYHDIQQIIAARGALAGAIIGKALYQGTLDLAQVITMTLAA